jgi:hypothetical protein
MLFNEVRVLPTPETVDYLSMLFSASPLPLHLQEWSVILNQSETAMDTDPERVYEAKVETINVWYDFLEGQDALIMVLKSQDLVERALELRQYAPNPFYRSYYPYLVMLKPMPQIKRNYRAMINSWGDTLVRDQTPLLFDAELQVQTNYEGVPELNFYTDMDRRYNVVQ